MDNETSHDVADLFPRLYDEIRRIASVHMARENDGHTLQPTALVHEAYLRLSAADLPEIQNREHFLALASRAIRRILVDHARFNGRQRRRGERPRPTTLVESLVHVEGGAPAAIDLIVLDDALRELERLNPRHARIVEMRFFSGLTNAETARELNLAERTIERDWQGLRLWLVSRLA